MAEKKILNNDIVSVSTGKLGVGTTAPAKKLTIGGSSPHVLLDGNFDDDSKANQGRVYFNDYNFGIGAGHMSVDVNADDDLYLWTYDGVGRGIRFMSTTDGDTDVTGTAWKTMMVITSDADGGNVGIGTTSPAEKLEVAGSVYVNSENNGFIVDAGGNARVGLMKYGGAEGVISRVAGQDFGIVRTGSSDIHDNSITYDLYVNGSGNVGIGTTSPSSKLHVLLDEGTYIRANNVSSTVSAGNYWGFGLYEGTALSAAFRIVRDGTSDQVSIGTHNNQPFAFWQNATERMRIDTDGNVGIGTTSPGFKLQVNHGTGAEYVSSFRNTNDNLQIKIGTTTGNLLNIQGATINTNAAYNIALQADGGNVGIGTTSPGYKLQVSGDIYSEKALRLDRRVQYNFNGQAFDGENTDGEGRRYTIGRIHYSTVHWGYYGTVRLEVNTQYPHNGTQTFLIQYSGNTSSVKCIEAHGSTDFLSNSKIELGAETDTGVDFSGYNVMYRDIYLYLDRYTQARVYAEVDAQAFDYDKTTISSGEYYLATLFTTSTNQDKTAVPSFSNYQTVQLTSNGNNTAYVAGKLGIGTTSPESYYSDKLVVNAGNEDGITIVGGTSDINYLMFADGTVGNARYSGMLWYQHSTDMMAFSTSAANRMFITGSGNVGINTSSPGAKLAVEVAGTANVIKFTRDAGANGEMTFDFSSANSNFYSNQGGFTFSGSSSSYGVNFTAAGNVGIGTTSPNEKLQIAGNVNAYAPGGIDAGLFASTAAGSTTIALRSNGVTHFNGGNVGIGTSSPGQTLTVKGSLGIQRTSNTETSYIDMEGNLNVYAAPYNYSVIFHTGTGGTSSEKMRIDYGGNVGIGTTSPLQKLDVSGYARATSGFVGNTTLKLFGDNTSTEFVAVNTDGTVQITAYGAGILQTDASGNITATATPSGISVAATPRGFKLNGQSYTTTNAIIQEASTSPYIAGTTEVTSNTSGTYTINRTGKYQITYTIPLRSDYAERACVGVYARNATTNTIIEGSVAFEYFRYSTYGQFSTLNNTFFAEFTSGQQVQLQTYLKNGTLNYAVLPNGAEIPTITFIYLGA